MLLRAPGNLSRGCFKTRFDTILSCSWLYNKNRELPQVYTSPHQYYRAFSGGISALLPVSMDYTPAIDAYQVIHVI